MSISRKLNLSLISLAMLVDCGGLFESGSPDPEEPQTEVLNLIVEPDTVFLNDQVKITCIIRDSLDTSFRFYWLLQGYSQTIVTDTNSITIMANIIGEVNNVVRVDNGDTEKHNISRSFSYLVND